MISKYDFNEYHNENICQKNHHQKEKQIQQDEEGDQYVTKKEFNQFKEQIN